MQMKTLARLALTTSAALLFSGCGGSQSQLNGIPGMNAGARRAGSLPSKYAMLFSFDNGDGASPLAGLLNVNGTLYGTTSTGGAGTNCPDSDGCGTVFSVTAGGKERVLYKFLGGPDGAKPNGNLIDINGTLYGTTSYGGVCNNSSLGCGTVFSVTTGGKEKVLYRFAGHPDGESPTGRLINVNGTLYGTTSAGGNHNWGDRNGTVFSVTIAGKERVLYSFGPKDGIEPSPLADVNGTLYGTMYLGGAANSGTVFSVTLAGKEQVLYSFAGPPDGALPTGSLINVNGTLYGTTSSGGAQGCISSSSTCGTVFRITTAGNEHVLYRFAGGPDDGSDPNGRLLSVGGILYGTTTDGGTHGSGAVFTITTAGRERVLYSFGDHHRHDGGTPLAGLTDVKSRLYGTTYGGGDYRVGTVFALTP
jgi:uncharacterized repeat protein (TIGR03803 family)